jgi:Tfp pilus assembly protein PilO
MSRRERILIIVAATLVSIVGWYFYVYSPRQARYTELTLKLSDARAQLERMEATARLITRLEQEYRELQSFIATVEAKLPTTKEMPALLVQMERLTMSLGISLQSVRPGALEAVNPVPAAQSATPAASQPAPSAGATYYKFPIKLQFEANYAELLRLTNRFQNFPRLIVIRRITMNPRGDTSLEMPELNSDIDIETYVLPKEAR